MCGSLREDKLSGDSECTEGADINSKYHNTLRATPLVALGRRIEF